MNIYFLINLLSTNFDRYIYIILFVLLFLEEDGVPLPVPGDIYIFLAGYQVAKGLANPIYIVIDVTIASLIGASILFLVVRAKGEPLVAKFGKYIFLSSDKLEKGKNAFNKYGETVILIGRWIPGLRIALTVAAGIFELKYIKFIVAMFFSSIVWSSAFLVAGILARSQHMRIFSFLEYVNGLIGYGIYFGAFLLVAVGVYFYLKWYKRG